MKNPLRLELGPLKLRCTNTGCDSYVFYNTNLLPESIIGIFEQFGDNVFHYYVTLNIFCSLLARQKRSRYWVV